MQELRVGAIRCRRCPQRAAGGAATGCGRDARALTWLSRAQSSCAWPVASSGPRGVSRRPRRATIARDSVSDRLPATARLSSGTTLRLRKLSCALPTMTFGLPIVAFLPMCVSFALRNGAHGALRATSRTPSATFRRRNVSRRALCVSLGSPRATFRLPYPSFRALFDAFHGPHASLGNPNVARGEPNVAHGRPSASRGEPDVTHGKPSVSHRVPNASRGKPNASHGRPNASHGKPDASRAKPDATRPEPSVARRRRRASRAAPRGVFPGGNASLRTPNVAQSARHAPSARRAYTRRGWKTTSRGPSWADRARDNAASMLMSPSP